MADYQCYPLWWSGDANPGNIDPSTLPLNHETISELDRWADTFDSWINLEAPSSQDIPSDRQVEAFEQEGIKLWKQLREELSPNYMVIYHSYKLGKLLEHPNAS